MDSVQTIMKNSNNLLSKAIKLEDSISIKFKSAALLEEQNKLQALFSTSYEDSELVKQKTACINAYIYLEYAMIPFDDECKSNYYARCSINDLYTKCREYVRGLSNNRQKGEHLKSFITMCYKPVSEMHEDSISTTCKLDTKALADLLEKYVTYTNGPT